MDSTRNSFVPVGHDELSRAIYQLEQYARPDGPWRVRDAWSVDLGALAHITVTTQPAAEALAQLLRDAESWREFQDQVQ